MERLPARLDDLISYVRDRHPAGDALDHLADAVVASTELGEVADHLVGHFVDQARRAGASWTEIGQRMGVTKQAVQKRFVPRGTEDGDPIAPANLARFTLRARQVMARSQELATIAGHRTVDSLHITLALLDEPNGLAALAIHEQGVTDEAIRAAMADHFIRRSHEGTADPDGTPEAQEVGFSGEARKLLELVLREALRLGHNFVGTEHILLALLRDDARARRAGAARPRARPGAGRGVDHGDAGGHRRARRNPSRERRGLADPPGG